MQIKKTIKTSIRDIEVHEVQMFNYFNLLANVQGMNIVEVAKSFILMISDLTEKEILDLYPSELIQILEEYLNIYEHAKSLITLFYNKVLADINDSKGKKKA